MLWRKVIYVRSIKSSYNNVASEIRLLDKNIFCLYRKKFMQVRAFERYFPLRQGLLEIHVHGNSAVSGIVRAYLLASKEVSGAANSSICTSSVFVVDIWRKQTICNISKLTLHLSNLMAKEVSMTRKYHNHTLQTKPRHH